jgi:hypothetical protein
MGEVGAVVVCGGCGRGIDACGFCGERCGREMCYRCVLFGLAESVRQPHLHGG